MKKTLIISSLVFAIAAVLLVLLFIQSPSGLMNPRSFLTPEKAAVHYVKGMTEAGFHIDTNTVEAIQQVEINGMVLVLVQYSGFRIEGDAELCETLLEVEKKMIVQWEAKGGAGLCHKENIPHNTVPISVVSSYGTTTLLNPGYSTAFGYLRNEQISKVVVTWEDGQVQPAKVSARTYLTAREGRFHVEKIETYNDLGEIIFESDYPNTQETNP